MDFLGLAGKIIVVFGIANRKSVAFHVARLLDEAGARLVCSVQLPEHEAFARKSFPNADVRRCDLADEAQVKQASMEIIKDHNVIHGIVHSVAFANFAEGLKPFHDTSKADFLQAMDISCFSLISLAGFYKDALSDDASIVTISISSTRMAAHNYGYMAPIKAALDSSVVFLAKSLGNASKRRVNAVGASLLKTSASAGIPGYLNPYLFAEQATIRKEALKTEEVANTAVFLLSQRSSGINAQTIIVDAGMSANYFDSKIVDSLVKNI